MFLSLLHCTHRHICRFFVQKHFVFLIVHESAWSNTAFHLLAHTQALACFENLITVYVREKDSFLLGDGLVKSTLLGGLADVFANNTVISSWRAKHASVCLLISHKRTAQSDGLIHKQRQTFPLLCRLLSFSLFYFPPSSLSPGRAYSYTHPGTSLEVFRPHTEQCKDLSLTLSFSPAFLSHAIFIFSRFLYHSLLLIVPFFFSTSHLLSVHPDSVGVKVVCPLLHVSISTLGVCSASVCLNVLM